MKIRTGALALALLAHFAGSASAKPAPSSRALTPPAKRGLAFAQTHCTTCHAITANTASPNPESPPFDDIANTPGLTAQTFAAYLSNAHNYPAAMDFTVNRARIGDLAAYMLTLRKRGYRPSR